MRYSFYSLIALLLLTSANAQSNKFQAGEILLKNGIQKTGYILGQFQLDAPKGVYFKPDEVTKSEYLEFSDIQEVRFGETLRYITHCTQNTAQERCHWLKTLLIGKVSLHQSAADEGLYFMEEGGTFNGIRSPSFEGTLNLLKRKCEGFVAPANARFGTASLIQVVANYAKCKYPQEQVQSLHNAEETPANWFIGPKVGVNFGNASIFENHYYGRGAYQASPALTSGAALQLQIAPNWSASIEVVYFQRSFSADSVNVWPVVSPNYSKVNLDLAFLEIPFAGQYYFSKGKIAPYIQAGLHLGVPIKRSLAEEQFRANADELEDQPKNSFLGPAFGYGGGLGLKLQLSEKMTLQLSGQFTKFATTLSSSSKAFESSGFEDRTPIDMPRIQAGGVLFLDCKQTKNSKPMSKPTILHASIGRDTYKTTLQTDDHQLIGDEPPSSGGTNLGPDPYEFILAGLATCTAATVRMYADRKAWDLEKIDLSLSLQVEKLSGTQITHIQREIQFFGNLSEEQTQRLLEIADKCPVHRLLTHEVKIVTRVSANTAPPKSGNDAADAQPQ